MKKLTFSLLIVFALTVSMAYAQQPAPAQSTPQTQEKAQQKPPELPDFSQEPFVLFIKRVDNKYAPVLHRDWGATPAELYASQSNTAERSNHIMLFMNKDGSKRYAEWRIFLRNDKMSIELYLGYTFQDGKFVFENAKRAITRFVANPTATPSPSEPISFPIAIPTPSPTPTPRSL